MVGLLLAGCGTVPSSSGPVAIGPDTWRIFAKDGMKGSGASQAMALQEADAHCQGLGRKIMTVSTVETMNGYASEVTFRCLKEGDLELVRPTLERMPDAVIKIK